MLRFFYNILVYLLLIPFAFYWLIRGLGNRTYLDGLGQRFGFSYPRIESCIWIHAVSVGEVQAAVPLIRTLRKRFPDQDVLVTTVTPTGAARVKALFGESVSHSYVPFEFLGAIGRFFASVNPQVAMIMETEIWPNLYRGCGVRKIPLILVSARISPKSLPGYRRLMPLIRETLSHGIIIAAQSQADADRFTELGASSVRTWVTGNIKFDVELDAALHGEGEELRRYLFGDRPVWIAASTHDDEELQVLNAHRQLLRRFPDLMLVLIPRHPARFDSVHELVAKEGFSVVLRTGDVLCNSTTDVFLVNTMGEVPLFYAASDLAFVGGSLVPVGGHNLLEPAALGLPIITGPNLFNAQDIADKFARSGACRVVNNADELAQTVASFLSDPAAARKLGENALGVLETNRGSLKRLLVLVEPLLVNGAAD